MSSLALVRSRVVGSAQDLATHNLTADLTMKRSTAMDHERFERSVFGPTGSVSRPSPSDPCRCVPSGLVSPRGSTNCSTAFRPIGLQVAASSRWQLHLIMQQGQPYPGLQVGDANLTMAGSMNLRLHAKRACHAHSKLMVLRSANCFNCSSTHWSTGGRNGNWTIPKKFSPRRPWCV